MSAWAAGLKLRHVLDVRHESFNVPEYVALARRYGCTTVHTDSGKFPSIVDAENNLAYIRLMRSAADRDTGYAPELLEQWAAGARVWIAKSAAHEVFIYFINGAKERAPAAATELIRLLA